MAHSAMSKIAIINLIIFYENVNVKSGDVRSVYISEDLDEVLSIEILYELWIVH